MRGSRRPWPDSYSAGCRRRSLPVSGAPTPAVGCVALTQSRRTDKSAALRDGDRTRPFGRRSYTLGGRSRMGGEPGSRQPEQYALDRGTSQIRPERQLNPPEAW